MCIKKYTEYVQIADMISDQFDCRRRGTALSQYINKMKVFLLQLSHPGFQNAVAEEFSVHHTV